MLTTNKYKWGGRPNTAFGITRGNGLTEVLNKMMMPVEPKVFVTVSEIGLFTAIATPGLSAIVNYTWSFVGEVDGVINTPYASTTMVTGIVAGTTFTLQVEVRDAAGFIATATGTFTT